MEGGGRGWGEGRGDEGERRRERERESGWNEMDTQQTLNGHPTDAQRTPNPTDAQRITNPTDRVEEVVNPLRVSVVGLTLRQLVVVVRELEVGPSRVNVKIRSKHITGDDGALDVPTWTTRTPRRLPLLNERGREGKGKWGEGGGGGGDW